MLEALLDNRLALEPVLREVLDVWPVLEEEGDPELEEADELVLELAAAELELLIEAIVELELGEVKLKF